MNKLVKTSELYETVPKYLESLFSESEYPWQILPLIKGFISAILEKGKDGYTTYKEGVLIGENVKIYQGVTIEGPCIIGSNTELRPGAFIRGSVIIGEGCVIGNSTEIKNSILLDRVQVPHYNYVGDSILGYRSHMGAGSIASNLKSDGKDVIIHGSTDYSTGLRKVGAFLGEGADVGCGVVMNPGTVIGNYTRVYPLISLRGVYPSESIIKGTDTVVSKNSNKDILL